jgi:hypothetical protein
MITKSSRMTLPNHDLETEKSVVHVREVRTRSRHHFFTATSRTAVVVYLILTLTGMQAQK